MTGREQIDNLRRNLCLAALKSRRPNVTVAEAFFAGVSVGIMEQEGVTPMRARELFFEYLKIVEAGDPK